MAVVTPLVNPVKRQIDLSVDEQDFFISLLKVRKLKRKQLIDHPGHISRNRNYVVKGALRGYVIDTDGKDHTISLAIEDWFIGDPGSYMSQEPGSLFVEAMEDCTLVQISFENEQLLLEKCPKFERYFKIMAHRTAVSVQKRVIANISQSAEERYANFLQKYPQLVNRFPIYIIASYLGMSREFLSKIRNQRK